MCGQQAHRLKEIAAGRLAVDFTLLEASPACMPVFFEPEVLRSEGSRQQLEDIQHYSTGIDFFEYRAHGLFGGLLRRCRVSRVCTGRLEYRAWNSEVVCC